MADVEVVVTEGSTSVVQVEEEPDVFVNVAIPPPVEVVEVRVPGPAGPPGEPGPQGEPGSGGGVTDHGALTGLSDDDHLQYHTDARGDARYLQSIPSTYATDAEVASAIGTHEAAADPHTGYQKESEKGGANGYASLDGDGLVPTSQLPPGSSTPADASTTLKGISKLSSTPASPTNPIAVGDNDVRIPTQGENDALAGTNGAPSSTNLFVTDSDPRNTNARTPSAHEHDADYVNEEDFTWTNLSSKPSYFPADHIENLEADTRNYDEPPTAYPVGVSSMPSTDYNTANRFASEHGEGAVKTTRYYNPTDDIENCIQVFEWAGGGIDFRTWSDLLSTWSDWVSLNNWDDIYNKPSTFPPSAHAASHTNGTDQIANATTSAAGLESAADKTKLDGIESGATADQTASEILTAIKTVDGSGSGLDADTLDGHDTAYFAISSDLAAKADLVGGVVPTSQIPALAINDVFTVASQAAMLALTAQRGDIAVRTDFDPDRTYMLSTDSPGTLADWIRVTFGDVVSVNGQTGVIVLGYADVGAASTTDTRIPTQDENDALVGTNGTPSTSNKFVTNSDSRNTDTRTPTDDSVTNAKVAAAAAIAESKLNLASDAAAGTASRRTLGTGAQQAAAGNDSRLSDARTPTAHKTSHEPGGSDAMSVDAAAATGSLRTLGTGATQATAGNDSRLSNSRTPTSHATSHVTGGSDVIANAVASGNSGLISGSNQAKLDAIEAGATADMTAAEILTAVKTVDGTGSGLDADTLDGSDSSVFASAANLTAHIDDASDAHDASAISYAGGTGMSATDVEAAVDELANEKSDVGHTHVGGTAFTLTETEANLGSIARRSGKFNITSSGLATGKHVLIQQLNGPYTGKGTLADEAEMDEITATGKTTSATNIECYWRSPTVVRGNIKFGYAVSA